MNVIDWILSLLGTVLNFFNSITGNYLLAIFLFALLFKIILFPLSIKQQKNQVKQAKLQPKVAAINKKYNGKTDPESQQKKNMEIQEMYQSEGFNAMGGCLPLLLQMPIILALYSVIRNPLQYICGVSKDAVQLVVKAVKELSGIQNIDTLSAIRHIKGDELAVVQQKVTELAGTTDVSSFTSLAEKDLPDFSLFGLNFDLSITPWDEKFSWYLLIPILTFVALFLSSKLTRKLSYIQQDPAAAGCSNWVMDLSMPAMSTYFAFIFPALLGVYWMFNNLLGIAQQLLLRVMFPAPKLTEADYKEAERALRGKSGKNTIQTDTRVIPGKKYVSLHHIDDDDEYELPVLPLDSREEGDDDETKSDDTDSPAPKLKDESDKPKPKKK